MCALRAVKVGERGQYVLLPEDRDGASHESTESHFAGAGEKDHVVAGSRKMAGATGCGKDAEWKSQENDLSHPAWKSRKPRGIPTFPQPRRLREIN